MSAPPWDAEETHLWAIVFSLDDDQGPGRWAFAGSDISESVFQVFEIYQNSNGGIFSTMPAVNMCVEEDLMFWLGPMPTILWPQVALIPNAVTDEPGKKWTAKGYMMAIWDEMRESKLIEEKIWVDGREQLQKIG